MINSLPLSTTYTAILSPQGQITIPAKIRELLSLKTGTTLSLLVKTVNDKASGIVALVTPKDPIDKYYGIGKDIYKQWGGAEKVVAEERMSWKNR